MARKKKLRRLLARVIKAVGRRSRPVSGADPAAGEGALGVAMKAPSAASTLSVERAKELIFERLCEEYKARGAGAWVDREALRRGLGISEDLFRWALREATSGSGSLFVDRDYTGKRIFLGTRGRTRCEEDVNPFAGSKPLKE